jgi:hypothetical protein
MSNIRVQITIAKYSVNVKSLAQNFKVNHNLTQEIKGVVCQVDMNVETPLTTWGQKSNP